MKYSWEIIPFDSEILGFTTAKISHVDNQDIPELKNDLLTHHVEYATYRIAANNYSTIQNLEKNGFVLVDALITLEATSNKNHDPRFNFIKRGTREDYLQLIDLAGHVFRGVSRYYHDPVISTKKADNIYKQWMGNSLNGSAADAVLVWKEEKGILGFITLQKRGQIPLIAVSEKARGKGIGTGLLYAGLSTFQQWGVKKIIIETQITNINALRLYHSCGFAIVLSQLTFRWHSSSV